MKIREYLKEHILLFDGAMGSYFSSIHPDPLYPCEEGNMTCPQTISEIHKGYLEAGAKAIKTNTFSLPEKSSFPLEELIPTAYGLAKKQGDLYGAYVFADMNIDSRSLEMTQEGEALSHYEKIIDLFLAQGAEHFLFETCTSGLYLNELAQYIKEKSPEAYILASFAVGLEGFTSTGESATDILADLSPEIDGLGFNCICGPHHMLDLMQQIKSPRLISAMPNASYPTVLGKRLGFGQNPQYFAEEMGKIAQEGIRILGGCCGTTPDCIAQLAKNLRKPREKPSLSPSVKISQSTVAVSAFYEKLKSGEKPIAVEWDSPSVPEITDYMAKAKLLQASGVDLLTIADCPVARPRIDSSLVACKLKRELAMDAMPHMTCRDRNINAVKALLLGLSVEEVNNVLLITGDPIPQEQRKEIKTVYEFNSRMLIRHIESLNQSLFSNPFYLYGALNINALNFQVQLGMAKEKIKNGAVALFTQPVMSQRGYDNLKIAKEQLSVPLVGGIFPAVSERNIRFLTNEISGFHVAPELSQLYQGKSPEECSALAISVSQKIAQEIAPFVDGFYLITPFTRVDLVLEIVKTLKELQ